MAEWKTLSLRGRLLTFTAMALLIVAVGYIFVTLMMIGLGNLGIGESCKPGC